MLMDQTDIAEYFGKNRKIAKAAVEDDTFPKPLLVRGKLRYWGKPQVDQWLSGRFLRDNSLLDTDQEAERILSEAMREI